MTETIDVKFEKIHPDGKIPTKGTEKRAYYDVYSISELFLLPGAVNMVRTGIKVQPPEGWFIDIRPRSGLAKEGITINNSPGTLDCDYGGELILELIYHTTFKNMSSIYKDENKHPMDTVYFPYLIHKGDRIAQLSVMPMYYINFVEAKIEGTEGFGSTGI
jgi:dUTP pyrophosphatase